jgi:hypothetical protein
VDSRRERGDRNLHLVPGGAVLGPEVLADGIHPGDEGHRVLAEVFGGRVAQVAGVAGATGVSGLAGVAQITRQAQIADKAKG